MSIPIYSTGMDNNNNNDEDNDDDLRIFLLASDPLHLDAGANTQLLFLLVRILGEILY